MKQGFDKQTLEDLEFGEIRQWLSNRANGATAKQRMLELVPQARFETVERNIHETHEYFRLITEGVPHPSLDFEELGRELKLLPIHQSVLEPESFFRILRAVKTGNEWAKFYKSKHEVFPNLCAHLEELEEDKELIKAIESVLDDQGRVRDNASEELRGIRQDIESLRHKINRQFEKDLRKLTKENVLADTLEAFVDRRRVLAVSASYKRSIPGQVLGSSKSGAVVFVEPAANVPLNREMDVLEDDERREIRRILLQLTRKAAEYLPQIKAYQRIFTHLDFVLAKAKLAVQLNASLPQINKDGEIELIDAYHPILWKTNEASKKPTIPQHIQLNRDQRMLVISGPNAGGKSITLKTVGLLQLMVQSGLMIPVHPESRVSIFQQVMSDIGDNQSIANELSTYSYRLRRMNHFLQNSNRATLLLLDEFGTGSDPDLGGALAEVIFESLYRKKSFGVITTHYSNIKLKADQLRHAVNGCMLFDTETLAPLYRFAVGQPGSSFTFEVAQINGISVDLIDEAKKRVNSKRVEMDTLLTSLQKEKTYLESLNAAHIEAQEIAEESRINAETVERKFKDKLQRLQEKSSKQESEINLGKKLDQFIQRYKLPAKKKTNDPLIHELREFIHKEKALILNAQKEVQLKQKAKAKSNASASKKKQQQLKKKADRHHQEKITVGSQVKLIATKQSGTVEQIEGKQVTVSFGFARMKVDLEKLSFVK